MKKLLLSAVLLFIFSAPAVFGQAAQNFKIVNETGLAIDQLYISASTTDNWEEDVLGVDILEDKADCIINFNPKEERCDWDLKIIDSEGNEVEWAALNLCEAYIITLYYDKENAWAEIDTNEPTEE